MIQPVKLVWSRAKDGPRKVPQKNPPGRRRKGRSRNSWMQVVTARIGDLEWVDRGRWRKKINLL
jgi:hypothetical protein